MTTGILVDVVMPQMGVSVSEGTITRWAKNVGETIAADETIVEISTDKVDTEVPSPASGVVRELLAEEGETVPVNTRIAVIDTGGAGAAAGQSEPPATPPSTPAERVAAQPPATPEAAPPPPPARRPRITPPTARPNLLTRRGAASSARWWRGCSPSTTSTSIRSPAPAAVDG